VDLARLVISRFNRFRNFERNKPMSSLNKFARPALLATLFAFGCAEGSGANVNMTSGTGGRTTTGAGGAVGSGGSTGSGGDTGSGGSGAVTGTGGDAAGTGGILGTGGISDTGGTTGTGGATSTGGAVGTAGSKGTGGAMGTGGATGTGGSAGTAGSKGTGGVPGTGGSTGTGGTIPGWGTPVAGGPTGTGVAATVTVNTGSTVGNVGAGFAGLSYEKTHVMNGSLTSANAPLIALYKLLGSPVLRIGANDVDVCTWGGTGTAPAQPSGQPFTHSIRTGGVDQLCGFLAATGSKVIYGVNFAAHVVAPSAAEAAYVMSMCPQSIVGFEIGNEIDKYGSWAAQQTEWESFANAIVATPGALLVGPATTGGGYQTFVPAFAAAEAPKFGTKLTLLTNHYYVAGSGSNAATAASLQTVSANIVPTATALNSTATQNHVPNGFRIGEANTFSGHGQMGVSDTLISGLWAIDYMFVNAEHGAAGVNFHGGETGMDGTRPFYYEPIMENNGSVVEVHPEYYGMLLFVLAGQGAVVSTTVNSTNGNFTAYAIKGTGFTSVVLDNKSATSAVSATLNLGAQVNSASAIYLQGTPAGSLTVEAAGVTLAGAPVTAAGAWNRNPPFIQATSGNTISVFVPAASAALVRIPQ
jgi:hypothetical protein